MATRGLLDRLKGLVVDVEREEYVNRPDTFAGIVYDAIEAIPADVNELQRQLYILRGSLEGVDDLLYSAADGINAEYADFIYRQYGFDIVTAFRQKAGEISVALGKTPR